MNVALILHEHQRSGNYFSVVTDLRCHILAVDPTALQIQTVTVT